MISFKIEENRSKSLQITTNRLLLMTGVEICHVYNMTYLGHFVTLTSGQIFKLTFRGQVIYQKIRLDERNTLVLISFSYLWNYKSY